MCQIVLRVGTFQISDLVTNTGGGLIGGIIYWIHYKLRNREVCDVASAADLPHSGDSRLDGDSGTVVQLILFQLIGEDGAGSC